MRQPAIGNIPTIEDLIEVHNLDFPGENLNNVSKELLEYVIDLIQAIPEFYEYLIDGNFHLYYLSYCVFPELQGYMLKCYKSNDIDKINKALLYIDGLVVGMKENQLLSDLILAGLLESFDIFEKDFLHWLVSIMPSNLKKCFLEYFPDYM